MAIQTIEYLKSKFETGDIPIEDDFVDLIDTLSTPSDTKLGFLNKSNWVDSEQISITLDTPMDSIVEANVSVYEEIPQTGLTNSIWDIITGELGFTLADSAYAVILTPSATTGDSINFTLGSGSWSSSDIGKIIKNVSESETGEARIISIVDDIATCKITIDFTDTNAIAGGDWELYSGEFIDGGFALSSATQVGIPGTPQVFESSTTYYISVAMLTSTKAIVCYRDAVNSNFGTACILDVSGTTITHGTPQVFESSTTQEVSVAMLTSTKAIVCYRDAVNSNFGTACILDVSGTTITHGTPQVFESSTTQEVSVAMLTSTKAIVCYRDAVNSNFGTACILDVSGTTITHGTPQVFESSTTQEVSVAMLTSTKAIVCYRDVGNSSFGTACILDISNSTITSGTPQVFKSSKTQEVSVAMLTSTKAIVCYRDVGNSSFGTACILDISNSTITSGTPQVFKSSKTQEVSVAMLTSTKAIVCYRDAVNSNFGTACILDVSGTTITHGTPQVFESSTTQEVSVAMLTSTKAIVCYRDVGNTSFGTACILNTEIPLYISSQHVPAISNNNDSVDTTYYIDLNSVTATETLNSQIVNYTFSFNPTFTDSDLTGGTFIIIGSGQSTVRNIVSSLNTVHGGTEGNWYINTNITYSSETWIAATTNSAHGALSQAEAIAVNNMSGTDVGNVIDVNWPEFGTKFACAIILYSNDINKTPNIDKIEFNYDANVLNQLETDQYTIDIPSTNIINVTAPLTGGSRNARVYISK